MNTFVVRIQFSSKLLTEEGGTFSRRIQLHTHKRLCCYGNVFQQAVLEGIVGIVTFFRARVSCHGGGGRVEQHKTGS